MANWIDDVRAAWKAKGFSDPRCDRFLSFCEGHKVVPVLESTVDLWGFGEVPVMFVPESGKGWWIPLDSLVEPSGLDYGHLLDLWHNEHAESADLIDLGDGVELEVVRNDFVFRVFLNESPWSAEFCKNMQGIMSHAFLESGLADKFDEAGLKAVGKIQDGEFVETEIPFSEAISEGLPSKEVARHSAHAGPLGAFNLSDE